MTGNRDRMANGDRPVLVTGAGGGVGGVGRTVVALLRQRDLPVRALVHHDDERADALRSLGAHVMVGDLVSRRDVVAMLDGVDRMLFCMSVSPDYLEAAATLATVAQAGGGIEALVNLSQMTVSQMTAVSTTESHQQRLHWLAERVLDWSGLPVVTVRPTIFLDNPVFTSLVADSVAESGTIPLPFGTARTSPVAAGDVARVIATILTAPDRHLGQVYELTGPRTLDLAAMAEAYSRALGRPVSYVDVPPERWAEQVARRAVLTPHELQHIVTLARLHRQGRFDRHTDTVEQLTGVPPQTVEEFVAARADLFTRGSPVAHGRRS